MVQIKSAREIELMRKAGELTANVLFHLSKMVEAGVTLSDLDAAAEKMTRDAGAVPAFKGYLGYKHTLCTSVNEQVVHGIPKKRALVPGDIIGLDFGLVLNGYFGDSAITVAVGEISPDASKLMQVTKDSLYAGIDASRAGNTLKDVARAIEETVKPHGFSIVREFVGHGIGQKLHEDPQVPNYAAGASSLKLREGMTIAIEPMVNAGTHTVKVLEDKWTAVTADSKLSAHFEHSILITNGDPEILTTWEKLPQAVRKELNGQRGVYGERGPNPS
jgi:methionyl aminopeptidase